jgi:hypothetical protein
MTLKIRKMIILPKINKFGVALYLYFGDYNIVQVEPGINVSMIGELLLIE